jgi:hypothetical protein
MQSFTRKLFSAFSAGLVMLLMAAPGRAQVAVDVASSVEGTSEETGSVAVNVGALDGEDVLSFDFTVEYDPAVITITGTESAGTISEGLDVATSTPTASTFQVDATSDEALSGSGALIWLEYEFVEDGSSSLSLSEFTFNDGTPEAAMGDVTLMLPNTGAEPESIVRLPVFVNGLEEEGVLAYDFTVTFDPAVLTLDGVLVGGTLSSDATVNLTSEEGSIRVVGASGTALDGSGVLIFLTGTSDGDGSTDLNFSEIVLNDGEPAAEWIGGSLEIGVGLAEEEPAEVPGSFALHGNYPNPFNPSTTIRFDLPASAAVSVQIFDVLGRQVMALPSSMMQAGADRSLQINASALSSGTYLYRLVARTSTETMVRSGQMMLVK